MKYLYVPTTTLNFNNIFSTESISPSGFYKDRGFGYKFYETVPPSPFNNITLLYDKYPIFNIQDDGRDHCPMVLKIESSLVPEEMLCEISEQKGTALFSLAQTIYLNPSSLEVYFRTKEEMQTSLVKVDPSLTTKMVREYKNKFFVFESGDSNSFAWDSTWIKGIKDRRDKSADDYLKQDRRIDRLKGFSYGYVLGAIKSMTPREAAFRSLNRNYKNSLSSLFNNLKYGFVEGDKNKIRDDFRDYESSYQDPERVPLFSPSQNDSIKINSMKIENVLPKDRAPKTAASLIKLVNSYCLSSDFSGQFSDEKLEIATDIGKAIRKIVGSGYKWDSSEHRKYINALLNNVKSGSKFDFGSFDHLTMQSIAAFVLKGDDLEKLEDFLIVNGVGDLRFAFALWGAMFGFSKIPKTQYNLLFQDSDPHYAECIYDHIHSELLGCQPLPPPKPPSGKSPVDSLIKDLYSEFPAIEQWEPKIREVFLIHHGVTKRFCAEFNRFKVSDLGKINGVALGKVKQFFKNRLEQPKDSDLPGMENVGAKREPALVRKSSLEQASEEPWRTIKSMISDLGVSKKEQVELEKHVDWFRGEWINPSSSYYGSQNSKAKSPISETPEKARTDADLFKFLSANIKRMVEKEILPNNALKLVQRLMPPKE